MGLSMYPCRLLTVAWLVAVTSALAQAGPPPNRASRPPTDLHGDPLPPGALARLGTIRFRHGGEVKAVYFSPQGKTLASAGMDGTVRLWDTATGKEIHRLTENDWVPEAVAFSPDALTARGDSRSAANEVS